MRSNKYFVPILSLLMAAVFLLAAPSRVKADDKTYENPSTGYEARVLDEADLLTDQEEADLLEVMKPLTEYGNVLFASNDSYASDTASLSRSVRQRYYGSSSSTVFMIDMYNREIYIQSDGRIYRTVTKSYANTITDNVYTYATNGHYYACAAKAFEHPVVWRRP